MKHEKELPLLAKHWIKEGQQTGRFIDNGEVIEKNRSCTDCKRRYYSYPYSCNDGWPINAPDGMTTFEWLQKAERCINFEDNRIIG